MGHFGAHFAMLLFPTLAVVIAAEEGIPLGTVLGWSFTGYLLFGLGALPVGILADHLRAAGLVRIGVLGVGPALMLASAAEPGAPLAFALALLGAFAALYHPAGLGLISRTIRARGTALGINGIFGNMGIAGAPLAAEIASRAWGWRGALFGLGAGLLVLGIAVVARRLDEAAPTQAGLDDAHHDPLQRRKLFAVLLLAMMIGGLSYRASTVAQPAYFAERVDFMGHGAATSLVYLLGTVGQYLAGRLADRYDLRILYVCFHALSVPFVCGMAFLWGLPLLTVAAAFVFFSIGMQPIENSLVARFTPERWRCTGFGMKFSLVFGVGALSVRGVRALIEQHALSSVFLALGAALLVLVALAIWLAWLTRGAPILNQET